MENHPKIVEEASRAYDLPIAIVNKAYWQNNCEVIPFYEELEYLITHRNTE